MTHRRALVHDLDAVRPEVVDMFLRLVARRFDDLDAAVDDRLAIFRVRRRIDRWQDRQVHAERLAGHCATALDLGAQRSEEHTSELQSLMRTSYAVFCLKKKQTHSKRNKQK